MTVVRHLNTRQEQGFTLTELLIVITILSILVGFAIPSYRDAVMRASRSDAHIAIQRAAAAQERLYAVHNAYSDDITALGGSGSPEGLYTLSAVTGVWSDTDCSAAASDTSALNAYTIIAIPVPGKSQASDSKCTCIYMDSRSVKGSTPASPGPDECW